MKTTIVGRQKLEEGCEIACQHCDRPIRNLVILSTGKTVGTQCALRALGYSLKEVDAAPFCFQSLSELEAAVTANRAGGFCLYALVNGTPTRFVRGCSPTGEYTTWRAN